VVRCPTEITPFLTQITARASDLLKYDPVRGPDVFMSNWLPADLNPRKRITRAMTTTMMMMMTKWKRMMRTSSTKTLTKSETDSIMHVTQASSDTLNRLQLLG
jgi:hypothetical protein